MPIVLYLNELSQEAGCSLSRDEAQAIAKGLISTLRGVGKRSKPILFADRSPKSLAVGEFTLGDLLGGDDAFRDDWRYLKALDNHSPFRLPDGRGEERLSETIEYKHDGRTVIGLGYAHAARAVGVSLLTAKVWDSDELSLERLELLGEELAERQTSVAVPHASRTDHLSTALGGTQGDQLVGKVVAIYALDPALLRDVRDWLTATYAGVDVRCREDLYADDSLRKLAATADIFVVVTQKATHAATGCIIEPRKRAGKEPIYPSAATLRSVIEAITRALG